jgi:hypothetical protein
MDSIELHSFKNLRGGYFIPEYVLPKYINQEGNLGVNVKDHHTQLSPLLNDKMYFNYQLNEYVYEGVKASFWNKCQVIGKEWGYDYVESSGRSGGWACPMHLYNDGQYSSKFYYVKCPELNGKSYIQVNDAIRIERFNGFAGYIEKLFILVRTEIKHVTNIDDYFELQKEIETI